MFNSKDWRNIKDATARRAAVEALAKLHKLQRQIDEQQETLDRILEDMVCSHYDLEFEVLPKLRDFDADLQYQLKPHWSETLS